MYDNSGISLADDNEKCIVSNAGRSFDIQQVATYSTFFGRMKRVLDISLQRVGDLTRSTRSNDILIDLKKELSEEKGHPLGDIQEKVRNIRTDLDTFSPLEIQLLFYHGYVCSQIALDENDLKPTNIKTFPTDQVPLIAEDPCWLPFNFLETAYHISDETLSTQPRFSPSAETNLIYVLLASLAAYVAVVIFKVCTYPKHEFMGLIFFSVGLLYALCRHGFSSRVGGYPHPHPGWIKLWLLPRHHLWFIGRFFFWWVFLPLETLFLIIQKWKRSKT